MKKLLLEKKQFLLYCAIGAGGASLDLGVFSLLEWREWVAYQTANAVGYACGTLLSFILNASFNFRVTDRIAWRLAGFFGVAFLGWLVSAGCLQVLIGNWHCNRYAAKFATIVMIVLLQYNLNRLLSFRKAG